MHATWQQTDKMRLKKRGILLGLFLLLFVISFLSSAKPVSAVGQVFVCAEKTIDGKWCQNVPSNQVNTAFRQASSNCESTAFCKTGTCVDSQQGECRPNVPQRVCQESKGVWVQGKPESIQQCQLGCCLVGDQASFVTQTGCKGIASQYGVETSFNSQIKDFDQCLALSNPRAKGACVIDDGFQRDCKNIAKSECNALETSSSGNRTVKFNEGLLCTADVLATRCAIPSPDKVKTTCVEGKFGVYFLDTCGNVANLYDASKVSDKNYWRDLKDTIDGSTCGANVNNAGSEICGNCDYQAGSICKAYQRGNEQTPTKPKYGDFICADLSCTYKGEKYLQGEEWCANSPGADKNLPGSESYVLTCYNGEVTTTQCDSFRQSICRRDVSNQGYRVAACVANEWRDCVDQKNKTTCEDASERDCQWMEGSTLQIPGLKDANDMPFVLNKDGSLVPRNESNIGKGAACVPRYAPGLNETDAETACFAASEKCIVKFARQNRFDQWHCSENCQCLTQEWAKGKMNQCLALGDCGVKTNYIGQKGESYNPFVMEGTHVEGFDQDPIRKTKFPDVK